MSEFEDKRRERAVRPIGKAEDLFKIKPSSTQSEVARPSDQEKKLARYDKMINRLEGRGKGRRPRLRKHKSLLVPAEGSGYRLRRSRQPIAGPPWLIGVPLYDWRHEELHEIFEGFSNQLDQATDLRVLISPVGDPGQTGSWYEILRSPELAKLDEEAVKAYTEVIQEGGNADHLRRREVDILTEILGIESEQLPCIAFMAFPPSLPVGLLPIKREWISNRESQIEFATALRDFLQENPEIEPLIRNCKTNLELASKFGKLINDHFAELEIGRRPPLGEEDFTARDCIFKNQGETWQVAYEGIVKSVKHSIGMEYISHLLRRPGEELHAFALLRTRMDDRGPVVVGSAGMFADDTALRQYKESLDDLDLELEEAEDDDDGARIISLNRSRVEVLSQIAQATGLNGRKRKASDDRERARQSVSAAIRRAIANIKEMHPQMSQHLVNSLRMGEFLCYEPDHSISWDC